MPKISIGWVGCTNVTDRRQTTDDRQTTDGRRTTYSEHEHEFTFAKNGTLAIALVAAMHRDIAASKELSLLRRIKLAWTILPTSWVLSSTVVHVAVFHLRCRRTSLCRRYPPSSTSAPSRTPVHLLETHCQRTYVLSLILNVLENDWRCSCMQAFDWYRPRWPWMTFNGVIALILRFKANSIALLANYVTVVEDRPLLSVKYCLPVPVFHFWPKLTHPAARCLCDGWPTCLVWHSVFADNTDDSVMHLWPITVTGAL